MSRLLKSYCNGYVLTPIMDACCEAGLFELLAAGEPRAEEWLRAQLRANGARLAAVLRVLEVLGWLERTDDASLRMTQMADAGRFDGSVSAFYGLDPRARLMEPASAAAFAASIEREFFCNTGARGTPQSMTQGALIVLLMESLRSSGLQIQREQLERLDGHLGRVLLKLATRCGWLSPKSGKASAAGVRLVRSSTLARILRFSPVLQQASALVFARDDSMHGSQPPVWAGGTGISIGTGVEDSVARVVECCHQAGRHGELACIVDMSAGDAAADIIRRAYEHLRNESIARTPQLLLLDSKSEGLRTKTQALSDIAHEAALVESSDWSDILPVLRSCKVRPGASTMFLQVAPSRACAPPMSAQHAGSSGAQSGLDRWQEYFKRWAAHLGSSRLLVLEAHPDVWSLGEDAQRPHAELLKALVADEGIAAESFLVLAAHEGLFNGRQPRRYPKRGPVCLATLSEFARRDYVVRHANIADLERLCELEELCWQHTRSSRDRLEARLRGHRDGQFVLERQEQVLAVIYSQRITSIDSLEGHSAASVHELHDPRGAVVQLLALNVDPEMQNAGYGDQLLEFMLQRCSVMTGVRQVIGVTLCKSYQGSSAHDFEAYIRRDGFSQDPVLTFHQAHGASVVRRVPRYRPEDVANHGCGVLVSYDIHNRGSAGEVCGPPAHAAANGPGARALEHADLEALVDATLLEILRAMGGELDRRRPLMEMGLDSADLLKLQRELEKALGIVLGAAFFFEYSTADKVINHLAGRLLAKPAAPPSFDAAASAAQLSPASATRGDIERRADIAIIGISCKLPGGIETLDQLWQVLESGACVVGSYPATRGPWTEGERAPVIALGGFVTDVESFDAGFFRMSPAEAQITDPQQRMLLELAWTCLEDAGVLPASLKQLNSGVFIGASNCDYSRLMQDYGVDVQAHHGVGSSLAMLANRISYFFDLSGPSLLIDTACSSSLVALHTAIQSLRVNECGAALVGGVNLICHPDLSLAYHKAGMLAADGRCKVFDAAADGYVRSEGAVMLLLKPLHAAIAAADHVHAVIRGSAINHGGLAGGVTVPNPQQQCELLKAAWKNADISISDLTYIEAHGTGTALGDPIEVQGIHSALYGAARSDHEAIRCAVGSVKSNLGHLESAAGLAGVLKVVASMQNGYLPASIGFSQLNPKINLPATGLSIQRELEAWLSERPRVAGVSSFGSGGANAHVVIEEFRVPRPAAAHRHEQLFVLSATTQERLRAGAEKVVDWLQRHCSDADFADAIRTWQVGRTAMSCRIAMLVVSRSDLREKLSRWLQEARDGADVWWGDSAARASKDRRLWSTRSGRELIRQALIDGELEQLAILWTSGVEIDWSVLGAGVVARRVSVPTYAFAKERHWVTRTERRGAAQALHPLLHSNASDLTAQKYLSAFSGEEFFLKDHRVRFADAIERVLPAVAYLEMVREALARALPGDVGAKVVLTDIVWSAPIVVRERTEVGVALLANDSTHIDFEVRVGQAEHSQIHCQGRASLTAIAAAPRLDLERTLARMTEGEVGSALVYAALRNAGLHYGPAFQSIQSVRKGNRELLAYLHVPPEAAIEKDDYQLHPSVLDGALQAAMDMIATIEPDSGGVWVPFSLDVLRVLDRVAASMVAWVRLGAAAGDGAKWKSIDIDLCDREGNVCVQMQGLAARPIATVSARAVDHGVIGSVIASQTWKPEQVIANSVQHRSSHAYRDVLLTGASASVVREIESALGSQCHAVTTDESWSVAQRYAELSLRCFERIAQFIRSRPTAGMLMQVVIGDGAAEQVMCGISGMLRTAELENPKFKGQLIVTSSREVGAIVGQLQAEQQAEEGLVRYVSGQREVLRWRAVGSEGEGGGICFKEGGVYLISGGLGGLGVLFAREIFEHSARARVVLTGRGELSGARLERYEALSQLALGGGGELEYVSVDLGSRAQVEGLISRVRSKYGALHGIVHSAGMIADNFILKKTRGEFEQVLQPKVSGTYHLDEASRDVELDFFVLFSSIAGSYGNVGQADYAAGNGFMDGYAQYRAGLVSRGERSGETVSIGWPLWVDGGMRIEAGTVSVLEAASGLRGLPRREGLAAFHRCMQLGQSRALVLMGELDRVGEIVRRGRLAGLAREVEPAAEGPVGGAQDLLEQARQYLRKQCARVLKLPSGKLDVQAPLERYGIDSIMAMNLTSELEKTFGSLSKTLFFEYQTIAALAEYFVAEHGGRLARVFSAAGPAPAPSTPAPRAEEKRLGRVGQARLAKPAPALSAPVSSESEAIAIIGVSGRYPQALDLAAYWQNLREGRDCIEEVPAQRWDWREYFSEDRTQSGRHFSKWGGFIAGVDEFDPLFFNISPREAVFIDPQERLFLQHAWMAVEDAGYTRAGLQIPREQDLPGQVGVYAGLMYSEYQLCGADARRRGKHVSVTGSFASVANRVSYALNLHGPSMTLDTMCSSSLTAIHVACQDLKQRRTDLAIAGGVNVSIHPNKYLLLSVGQFISSEGHCQSFGEGGDGYIPGEGVGAVILKRLSEAQRDGDQIHAVIIGSALSHGGKTNGYTVPNPRAQASVISQALKAAGVEPRHISYVEAHGTGTKLGDPIEIAALSQAFGAYSAEQGRCYLGSAKSNIGHCESAAGIAGLTKLLLQLRHRELVPSLHSGQLNPHIDFEHSRFIVNQRLRAWEAPREGGRVLPRIGAVSSFGAGGSNAHVIVREHLASADSYRPARRDVGIVLSARTPEQLKRKAQDLLAFLHANEPQIDLHALAYTLQVGREAMEERVGLVLSSVESLLVNLRAYVDGQKDIEGFHEGQVRRNAEAIAVFADDEDLQRTVEQWLISGKTSRVLELWVKGLTVAWDKLYVEKPRRVSLPTYPFAQERYWIEGAGQLAVREQPVRQVLHPLLHANRSDLGEQRYTTVLSGEESVFSGTGSARALSGAVYLEMARAALERAWPQSQQWPAVELRQVQWGEPVQGGCEITIALFEQGAGDIGYEIYSGAAGQQQIHCQGYASGVVGAAPGKLELQQLQGAGGRERLVELRAAGPIDPEYVLEPHMLEDAVGSALGLVSQLEGGERWVAHGLESLRIHGKCSEQMWAWVRVHPRADREVRADIDVCDGAGGVCVQLQGLRAQGLAEVGNAAAPPAASVIAAVSERAVLRELGLWSEESRAVVYERRAKPRGLVLGMPQAWSGQGGGSSAARAPIVLRDPAQRVSATARVRLYAQGEGVFSIWLSGAASPSASSVIEELLQGLRRVQQEPSLKVLVIRGTAQCFWQEHRGEYAAAQALGLDAALLSFPYPIIAAMQGDAVGLGLWVGMLCDFMVWSEQARYGCGERGASVSERRVLEERFGQALAQVLLEAGQASGESLKARGFSCAIVPAEQVQAQAGRLAGTLAQRSGLSLKLLKQHLVQPLRALSAQPAAAQGFAAAEGWARWVSWYGRQRMTAHERDELSSALQQWELPLSVPRRIALRTQVIHLSAYAEGIAVVKMEDREAKNMFSEALLEGMREAFAHIDATAEYRVVILTGYEQYFSSGGTKQSLIAIQEGRARFTDYKIYQLPMECRVPVIAALQGHGIGAGWSLGMFADFVLLSAESQYLSPYMQYGFTPGAGATFIFPCKIGHDLARETLLTAQPYTGRELRERGVMLPVLPRSQLLEAALRLARQVAGSSRARLLALKQAWTAAHRGVLEAVVEAELGMHEQTFVGRADTLALIHSGFAGARAEQPEVSVVAPAAASTAVATPERGSTASADVLSELSASLRQMLAQELHIAENELDEGMQFVDLGLDSISGVSWIRKINQQYGTSIEATKVYSYPTLKQLSRYVREQAQQHGTLPAVEAVVRPVIASLAPASEPIERPCAALGMVLSGLERLQSRRQAGVGRAAGRGTPEQSWIAVIGMAGEFAQAQNVQQFWENIAGAKNCITPIPPQRWDVQQHYQAGAAVAGKTNSAWMGALSGYDLFDPLFFNISPTEAQSMDPQQRVFLQTCWSSIEQAGYDARSLSGRRCGVFVGCAHGDYHLLSREQQLSAQGFTGEASSILAGRISYFLNLQGPCVSIDTACSSSLVAIAYACESLLSGASEVALAGGVYVMSGPEMHIKTAQSGMLSGQGRCFTFDQRADGFALGEAVGVVMLKKLADAQRDGDRIYALVQGWGVNQDGKTNGITAPNPQSQTRLQRDVYERFGIDPGNIGLIEAHGTGTKLGDPIEVEGLKGSFQGYTDKQGYCALGSVKSNIGHCLTAAGVAGFIKLVLALQHKQLPPTINFERLNEHIELRGSPFYINDRLRAWELHGSHPRQGAISSFGFSGTNAHLVLGEYEEQRAGIVRAPLGALPVVLSARSAEQLEARVVDLLAYLSGAPEVELLALAYTLQVGREAMEERLGVMASSIDELRGKLQGYADRQVGSDVYRGRVARSKEGAEPVALQGVAGWGTVQERVALLEGWVRGLEVHWARLYPNQPTRLGLPTYPFAKERYWIEGDALAAPRSVASTLHPLIHVNTSNFNKQSYSTTFDGTEFFLRDHRVRMPDGRVQRVLPGVVYLEMARAAVEQALPERAANLTFELRHVLWLKPAVIEQPRQLHIDLLIDASGDIENLGIEYRIHGSEAEVETTCCEGRVFLKQLPRPARIDVAGLSNALRAEGFEKENFYSLFEEMGLRYGPAHQAVAGIQRDATQVLAELSLPSVVQAERQFALHPSLMDSALQSSLGLLMDLAGLPSGPPMPFSLESLRVYDGCAERMFAWVRYSRDVTLGRGLVKVDCDLCDPSGEVCVQMLGVVLRLPEAAQLEAMPRGTEVSREACICDENRFDEDLYRRLIEDVAARKLPIEAALDVG